MSKNLDRYFHQFTGRRKQAGGLTIFTAIFVLILMTLMLLYATRVGIFEQRVSSNDARQKLAFQAAEAGIDYGAEWLLAASSRILSKKTQAAPDGAGGFYPGWLSTGNVRWAVCPDPVTDTDPCGGEIPAGVPGALYYDLAATTTAGAYDTLPLDAALLGNLPEGTEVRVTAVICPRTIDDPNCLAISEIPEADDLDAEPTKFTVWLLSYGYSDCNDDNGNAAIDVPDECRGSASVARPLGSFNNFKGSPTVPLVSKNTLPASGTAEVVPNPNGGGVGVPTSIWSNDRASICQPLNPDGSTGGAMDVSGSFKTCEMHEWYGVDKRPADAKCSESTCQCEYPGPEPISYRQAGTEVIGIDVISDSTFPCDLFEFYFGYPSSQYQAVKANATVINDCAALTTESSGFFWYSGSSCTLGDVGSINNPVLLVSASTGETKINANSNFFGILYIASVEDAAGTAHFQPGGGATVFGAVIVDVKFKTSGFGGTFRIVYNEAALLGAAGGGGLGGLAGGWRDFGLPEITWE